MAAAEPTAIAIQGSMRPGRGGDAGEQQDRLARQRHARRLEQDGHEDDEVAVAAEEVEQAVERDRRLVVDVGPDDHRDRHQDDGGDHVHASAAALAGGAAAAVSLTPSPASHRSMPFHAPRPRNRPLRHAVGAPRRLPQRRHVGPAADARRRCDARPRRRRRGARPHRLGGLRRVPAHPRGRARGVRRGGRRATPSASR